MARELEIAMDVKDYPTEYQKRNCTDVCCAYFGIAFSLVMIILAIILFNYDNFYQVNFPTDSNGALCGITHPGYPYLYFVNPPQMERRVCVAECPKPTDKALKCVPTDDAGCKFSGSKHFQVVNYASEAEETRNGNFCFPTDETVKNRLLKESNLADRNEFYHSIDTIKLSFVVAIGASFLFMLAVQCFPAFMNYFTLVLGCIAILISAVCVFLYRTSQHPIKEIIAAVLLCILLIILLTICKNTDSWRMHSIFLSYSTKMISHRCTTLFYIPIFAVILVAFIAMLVLEFTAFWSYGTVTFSKHNVYQEIRSPTGIVLSMVLVVQGVWGLTFIKEAFNFCVSGQAVNWYFEQEELGLFYQFKLLLAKHFGSVVGGSFMTGFFSIGDFIFDFLKPDENANPDSCYNSCYQCACKPCFSIYDLVRSDAMAFINMTGNPFINSARYCEFLCDRSIIMDYSQSTSRAYRICAHFLITALMTIFALYANGDISIYALLVVMVETIFVATLFISVHADATQAIQIIFLTEEEFVRKKKEKQGTYWRENLEDNLQTQINENLAKQVKEERQLQKKIRDEWDE